MPNTTVALIDLIGIKKRLADGSASAVLQGFWRAAEIWTNNQELGFCKKIGEPNTVTSAQAIVSAWSDSLLVQSEPEVPLEFFYGSILFPLLNAVSKAEKAYAIVSCGDFLAAPEGPALGGSLQRLEGSGPVWTQIFGSGDAWINLWIADRMVGEKKEWHDKYSLYAVGDGSVSAELEVKETVQIVGSRKVTVPLHALDKRA